MFDEICNYFGNQARLAKALNVTRVAVSIWKREGIPAARAIEIEKLTEGRFKAVEIINNEEV